MTTRRIKPRKEATVITVAIKSDWRFSAFLSGGLFALTFYIIPALAFQNLFLRMFTIALKPMMEVLAVTFALIAIFNFFRQTKSVSKLSVRHTPTGWGGALDAEPNRPASWSMGLLQQIEWKLFEDLSAAYYQEKGIRAELTKLGLP